MSQFRNLVFEGGGVKGIAYAGAIELLEKRKILGDIRRVAGTSAGAITATLLALGAGSADIGEIVGHTSFRSFMDDSFGFIRDTHRLLTDYGWYKGDAFASWIKKHIETFGQDPDLTFGALAAKADAGGGGYRRLWVVGTNLSMQMPQVFSAERTPDVPIWHAVRISMSIPLFFAAVIENHEVKVDGGVTWNYPIDIFDDKRYVSQGAGAYTIPEYTRYDENHVYNKETLGFRVDTRDEIAAEKHSWRLVPQEIGDVIDYIKVLVGFMMDMANKAHLHKNDWHRTVFIDAEGVGSTDFDLSDTQVKMLVDNGRKGAEAYLKWFQDSKAKEKPLNKIQGRKGS